MKRIRRSPFYKRAWTPLFNNFQKCNRFASRLPISGMSAHYRVQTQGIADEATDAQIDTLILDNRKKLNQIIGASMSFWLCKGSSG
jgi:hypothetical protein